MTTQERLRLGKARARLREALRQLDLALERGDDDFEVAYRVALAACEAFEGSRACRLLAQRMDWRQEQTR